MRKSFISVISAFVLVAAYVSPASASIINFEDLYVSPDSYYQGAGGMLPVPNGYSGFQWSEYAWVVNKNSTAFTQDTAYYWGTLGTMSLFTSYGANISFSGGTFDFNGAYLSAHADAPYDLIVQGLLGGSIVYSKTVTITPWPSLSTGLPYYYTFNFKDVDAVSFVTGGNRWVVIDNITINEALAEESKFDVIRRAVENLISAGVLKSGVGNSLSVKLAAAAAAVKRGQTQAAFNHLDAFVNQVNGLAQAGTLSIDQLTELTQRIQELATTL